MLGLRNWSVAYHSKSDSDVLKSIEAQLNYGETFQPKLNLVKLEWINWVTRIN